METLLECENLFKCYGRVNAIDKLSLKLGHGECIGLVGPNGAGKSTLLSLISGFIKPSSGTVKILGELPGSARLKAKTGLLPQDAPLKEGIKLHKQFRLFATLQGLADSVIDDELARVFNAFSVIDLMHRRPETLSHGQHKRVAMAQALLGNPQLVLLDEPTAGLDPIAANEVRDYIHSQKTTTNFIISSHNLEELENICDRIILLDQGQLLLNSPLSELTGQDRFLSITLESELPETCLIRMNGLEQVKLASRNSRSPAVIDIELNQPNTPDLQQTILQILNDEKLLLHEITRGKKLSDRVVRLLHGGSE